MKQFAKRISALVLVFVLSLAALAPAASAAASLPALPSGQCVVDDAGVLSSSTVQAITDLNAQLESSCNGAQIGVLTVDYTGNYSTEDYATEAFNTWDIGSASENNGVLILLVMESPLYDDGDYYVTYGDGFRNTTLESQAGAIAQTMEDDFVRKDYDSAVVTCANNVAVLPPKEPPPKLPPCGGRGGRRLLLPPRGQPYAMLTPPRGWWHRQSRTLRSRGLPRRR